VSAEVVPMSRAWDTAYQGVPSWETGRPQGAVERLIRAGAVRGAVLDAGCGTGIHAVRLARLGHRVVGLDVASRAVELARARAADAGVPARFLVGDALALDGDVEALGGPFDTILDVGLFHVLQPDDRRRYAAALASAVRPGGRALILAWSDRNPFGYGPERVTRRALRHAFVRADGWRLLTIVPERLETRLAPGAAHAWLATVERR
jgi:SAM-dependent methyltransferase